MRILLVVPLFAFVWGGALRADDPNPGRNRVAEAEKLPVTWDITTGDGVLWTADLGTVTYGGPTIAGDLVVVGTNNERPRDPAVAGDRGVVMAFDRRDGSFRWQITHEKLEAGDANDWPLQGVCSTPSFDGERLYYVSNRGEVVAANLDGGVDWSFDMVGEWGVFPKHMAASTPLALGDLVFVSTSNGVTDDGRVPAPEAPSFAAFERSTGRPVWRDGSPGAGLIDGQWGSPSHGPRRRPAPGRLSGRRRLALRLRAGDGAGAVAVRRQLGTRCRRNWIEASRGTFSWLLRYCTMAPSTSRPVGTRRRRSGPACCGPSTREAATT